MRRSRNQSTPRDQAVRRTLILAVVATTALLAGLGPAFPAIYETPGHEVAVATSGESASGKYAAVSNGGSANSDYLAVSNGGDAFAGGLGVAVGTTGCAIAPYGLVAVSLTGCAVGATGSLSGTGPSGYGNPACGGSPGCSTLSVSGTNCASSFHLAVSGTGCSEGDIALSGTGDAHGRRTFDTAHVGTVPGTPGVAVSGLGSADGAPVAVAPHGSASASPGTVWLLDVPVAGLGVAVAGGDANAYGGLVAVSTTGSARGGSVLNVGGGGCGC